MESPSLTPSTLSIIEQLEQIRLKQLSDYLAISKAKKLRKIVFNISSLLFLAALLFWAFALSGLSPKLYDFAIVIGSIILTALCALVAFSLYWLMQLPKKAKADNLQIQYLNLYMPYFLAESYKKTAPVYTSNILINLNQTLKASRLLKLQEYLPEQKNIALEFRSKNYPTTVCPIKVEKKISNNNPFVSLNGFFVKILLPELVQNNALFFSIHNNAQHFESLSFNEFILGDNEVRRLPKQHDQQIPNELVDEFNKYILMVGRNPAWLVNKLNETAVELLIQIDAIGLQNIRIEIDQHHLYAFIDADKFLAAPSIRKTWTAELLQQHAEHQLELIQNTIATLKALVAAIYE
jgi:hypothetical protein